jgi:hypothetical protein
MKHAKKEPHNFTNFPSKFQIQVCMYFIGGGGNHKKGKPFFDHHRPGVTE